MDTVYNFVLKDDLPHEYQKILAPDNKLPENVIFFMTTPMPWFRILMFCLIGLPIMLGTMAFYGHFFLSFFDTNISTFDRVIALLFMGLGTLGTYLFIDWCIDGFKIKKLISEDRWRQGVYLLKESLLIQLKGEDCYLIPRQRLIDIESVKVKGEGQGFHMRIDFHYTVNQKHVVLEINESDYELYVKNIDLVTYELNENSKLYAILKRWQENKLTKLLKK